MATLLMFMLLCHIQREHVNLTRKLSVGMMLDLTVGVTSGIRSLEV